MCTERMQRVRQLIVAQTQRLSKFFFTEIWETISICAPYTVRSKGPNTQSRWPLFLRVYICILELIHTIKMFRSGFVCRVSFLAASLTLVAAAAVTSASGHITSQVTDGQELGVNMTILRLCLYVTGLLVFFF